MKKETAKSIYNEAPDWYKTVLIDEFGEKTFTRDYTDIKTIEDARIATEKSLAYLEFRSDETTDEWAYRMLKMGRDAICQDWKLDWKNTNQKKWTPIMVRSAGSGFSGSGYIYVGTGAYVGSRLWFETKEQSDHFGMTFNDLIMKF